MNDSLGGELARFNFASVASFRSPFCPPPHPHPIWKWIRPPRPHLKILYWLRAILKVRAEPISHCHQALPASNTASLLAVIHQLYVLINSWFVSDCFTGCLSCLTGWFCTLEPSSSTLYKQLLNGHLFAVGHNNSGVSPVCLLLEWLCICNSLVSLALLVFRFVG